MTTDRRPIHGEIVDVNDHTGYIYGISIDGVGSEAGHLSGRVVVVPEDNYDDFTASDILAAFIRERRNLAVLTEYGLMLDGFIALTPEQAACLSPLFPPPAPDPQGTPQP